MDQVGIRALKQNASAVIADAAAGRSVTITDRGRAVAQLTPLPVSRLDQLRRAGQIRPAHGSLSDLPEPDAGSPLTPTLAAMRDDVSS